MSATTTEDYLRRSKKTFTSFFILDIILIESRGNTRGNTRN